MLFRKMRIRVSQKVNEASRVPRIGMLNNEFRSNLSPFNDTLIIFGQLPMECNNVDPSFDETLSRIICNYTKKKTPQEQPPILHEPIPSSYCPRRNKILLTATMLGVGNRYHHIFFTSSTNRVNENDNSSGVKIVSISSFIVLY